MLLTWWHYHRVQWYLTNPRLQWNPRIRFFISKRIELMRSVRDYKGLRNMATVLAAEANQISSPLKIERNK